MRKWSQEELEYLDNNWGTKSIPTIAKGLGRSINAVTLKRQRLGYKKLLDSCIEITISQLFKELGIAGGYSWQIAKLKKKGLNIRHKRIIKNKVAVVNIEDFWKWAEKNKEVINWSRLEPHSLGPEPEWVKSLRAINYREKFNTQPWKQIEDEKLRYMLQQFKFTYKELSVALNRTEGAIKRRIFDLGLKERPVKNKTKMWTESEIQTLVEMKSDGHSFEAIAAKLCRTALAVRGKYERLQNPEYNQKKWLESEVQND